jgi:hypothetical protein
VTELRQTIVQTAVSRVTLSREFVLEELKDNTLKAKELRQFSPSNRALELLGQEVGMFRKPVDLLQITSLYEVPQVLMDQIIALLEKAQQSRSKSCWVPVARRIDVTPVAASS